jgi:hypothetical protein
MFWLCFQYLLLLLVLATPPCSKAQERPFEVAIKRFAIPNSNLTYRTNVCNRQLLLFEGKLEFRDSLQGLNLTVAMTNYIVKNEDAFFTLKDGKIKEKDPGLFVVIMDEIAIRAGFQWRNSFAAIDPIDNKTDGKHTWTDLLLWEVAHFDIAADYWARSAERMALGVSFPTGWYDGSIIFATSSYAAVGGSGRDRGFVLWSFLLPFEPIVWVAIIGAILFTGATYFALCRLSKGNSDERSGLDHRPLSSFFFAALTFTGHFEFNPESHAARLLSFSWSFWALIMASGYTANLASFLVSRSDSVSAVSTVDDAVTRRVPVCIQRGAVLDEFFSAKYPGLQLVRKESEHEMFEALSLSWFGGQGGCGVVATNLGTFELYQSQKASNPDCSLTSEKRVISRLPAGFATFVDTGIFCTSLVSHVLDLHLAEMKADGFIEKAWSDHIKRISTLDCPLQKSPQSSSDGTVSLTMNEVGGIFILHGVSTVLALALAIFQYMHTKRNKPHKPLRPLNIYSSRNITRHSSSQTCQASLDDFTTDRRLSLKRSKEKEKSSLTTVKEKASDELERESVEDPDDWAPVAPAE